MNKIKIMNQDLANKIAAGEVIENQASVVKELVENSIDAQSTKIEINLIDSGFQLIQVVDNGAGIAKDDLPLAFKPHATSKIYFDYDLFNIESLGFRGEALASIASVAKVNVGSSTASNGGYIYDVNKDELKTGYSSQGTNLSVYNLFYNVPARLKHLQSQKSELSNIVNIISSFALLYPNIAFKLTNDNKILVNTNGNNDLLQVISNIYSLDVARNMEKIDASNVDFKISGYIANNKATRSNKKGINIFINKRLVFNKEIEQAIIKGYGTYLMEKRYPIVVLNIECDYQLVDVNVHPAKLEVRISNHEELALLIENAIRDKFQIKQREFIAKPRESQNKMDFQYVSPKISEDSVSYPSGVTKKENTEIEKINNIVKDKLDNVIREVDNKTYLESDLAIDSTIEENKKSVVAESNVKEIEYVYESFDVIGQFDATYILAQNEKGLHIIDQHAAMERINYEKKLDTIEHNTFSYQNLVVPIIIPLTLSEKMKVIELKKSFEVIGLFFEEQANSDLILRKIPTWIDIAQANQIIQETIDYVLDLKHVRISDIKKEDLILASCKMSLKANHTLSLQEQQSLIDELIKTRNYDHCPHGRPIIISLSKYEIEKMFKRVI